MQTDRGTPITTWSSTSPMTATRLMGQVMTEPAEPGKATVACRM